METMTGKKNIKDSELTPESKLIAVIITTI
jgi:hypothetical protein